MKGLKNFFEEEFPSASEITFTFDKDRKFVAYAYDPISEFSFVTRGVILWHSADNDPVIVVNVGEGSLFYTLRDFYTHLRAILRGERECLLFDPLSGMLGYQYNLLYADDPLAESKLEKQILSYKIWDSHHCFNVWLYTRNGIFYLEITPFLAWTAETEESEEEDTLEAFRERMRLHYKPIAQLVVPREVIERWYVQARELVSIIYKNYEQEEGGCYVDIDTQI